MKHTRKPVDNLVSRAKQLPPGQILPILKFQITKDGISYKDITDRKLDTPPTEFKIDTISYGVQDFVYTRIFTMIVVLSDNLNDGIPFMCYSFLCDSKQDARRITFALAAAFHDYSNNIKKVENNGMNNSDGGGTMEKKIVQKRRFAIDLRTPEEQQAALEQGEETEA